MWSRPFASDVKVVVTNKTPVTPIRGAGQPQGVFAMERLLDRVARELTLDRAEVRRRNLVPSSAMPYATALRTRGGMQVVLDSGDYADCMERALAAAGWHDFPARRASARREGRRIGMGLANFVEGTGRGPFEPVRIRVGENGRIHVASGASAMGQSTRTMLAQIVAEQLGGDLAKYRGHRRRHGRDRSRAWRIQQSPDRDGGLLPRMPQRSKYARRFWPWPAIC